MDKYPIITNYTVNPFQKLDANKIMMKLAASLEKQIGIINFPLTVRFEESDGYQNTAVVIPEVDVQAFVVSDGTIAVGTESFTPGCRTMGNGDPGYPDEYDFNEEGSVPLHQYQKAVDMMLQLAVIGAASIIRDHIIDQKLHDEWIKETSEEI